MTILLRDAKDLPEQAAVEKDDDIRRVGSMRNRNAKLLRLLLRRIPQFLSCRRG